MFVTIQPSVNPNDLDTDKSNSTKHHKKQVKKWHFGVKYKILKMQHWVQSRHCSCI